MRSVTVSDTSCLILLDKVGELEILRRLFGQVLITPEIADEFRKELPDWCSIVRPTNTTYQKILEASLDKGEASAIAFAIEHSNCLLIIDDYKGRRYAEQLGVRISGTLGVLISAKLNGHVESIKPILHKIKSTDFRLNAELEKRVLQKANEM